MGLGTPFAQAAVRLFASRTSEHLGEVAVVEAFLRRGVLASWRSMTMPSSLSSRPNARSLSRESSDEPAHRTARRERSGLLEERHQLLHRGAVEGTGQVDVEPVSKDED